MERRPQKVVRHYLQEMEALRNEGMVFAEAYPEVAGELGIGPDQWADPQAEMLVQSFAYLAARVRNQIDIDKSAVPNALLNHLSPHMQAPMPCMAIAEAQVMEATADGRSIERGRVFTAEARTGNRRLNCRFQNCYDTPIWPLTLDSISSKPVSEVGFINSANAAGLHAIVRLSLSCQSKTPINELGIEEKGLRFYVSDRSESSMRLYEMLSTNLARIYVKPSGLNASEGGVQQLDIDNLKWRGFEEEDAVLPDRADMHPGYRLIREYFGFPQKFLFFDIQGMDLSEMTDQMEIFFVFDEPLRSDVQLSADSLKLNCFPVINLTEQPIEPIRLTQRRYEYSVDVDRINQAYSEIYSIESLYSIKTGEAPKTISPCFELTEFEAAEDLGYFYSFRRELTESARVPGTRSYLSFHDHNLNLADVPSEAIGGSALCTNRRLPEKLNGKDANLILEGAGPIAGATLASKVSPYVAPNLDENSAWQLVSQLSLNFLSISGSGRSLETFKNILRAYADMDSPTVAKQIHGIKSLTPERISRYMEIEGNSGMVEGIRLTLHLDDHAFTEGRALLFASVCRYFFVLYASLGTFVQLVLKTDKREVWKTWQPMAGALVEL